MGTLVAGAIIGLALAAIVVVLAAVGAVAITRRKGRSAGTKELSLYVGLRNLPHPGFSACAKCGGNWGWKKYKVRPTGLGNGIFLFCVECDAVVTPEERWAALDEWKRFCISQLHTLDLTDKQYQAEVNNIRGREFTEFPR